MAFLSSPLSRAAARSRLSAWCRAIVMGAVAAGTSACAIPVQQQRRAPSRGDSLTAEVQLRIVLQSHWDFARGSWPEYRAFAGERVAHLAVPSLNEARRRASFARATINALEEIRIDALPEDQYVSWLTLYWEMTALQRVPATFGQDLSFMAPSASPLRTSLDILRSQPLGNAADGKRFLGLVSEYAALADSLRAALEWRASRGVTLPRLLIPRTVAFTRGLIASGLASPVARTGERFAADSTAAARFRAELADSIDRRVNPALERLAAYLEGEYATRATERIGVGQFPGGLAHYRTLVRYYSTVEITPADAHSVGLREVDSLDSLVADVRQRLGLPAARDSLRERLRADSALTVRSSGIVLDRILSEYGKAAAAVGPVLGHAPESTADVQAMDAAEEALSPLGVYVPPSVRDAYGHYRFNTQRWRDRSLLTLPAVVHQDLLPGRHVQAALQRENIELPAFRRMGYHPAFVEGWGAYSIELVDSLMAAADSSKPQTARLGSLLQRLSIACGLVVDTGINNFGWTHEQALSFLRAHLPDSDEELERELIIPAVERPGSLVAAGLGAREFRGLRRWAQRQRGVAFTLRALHDEVLSVGSVPLPVLGSHLEWWLWRERMKAATDTGMKRPPAASNQPR